MTPSDATADHIAARWVATALESWNKARQELQFNGSGELANHLWLTLDEALTQWGDRPLPPGAPSGVEILSRMRSTFVLPKNDVGKATVRCVHAIARHANAWTQNKKGQSIAPGPKSQAALLIQKAMETGSSPLVEGLLSATDAPPSVADQPWWKLPDKLYGQWHESVMGAGSLKRSGISLPVLALACMHQSESNQSVLATARSVLDNVDWLHTTTPAGMPLIALCSNPSHLSNALQCVKENPDIDVHLIHAASMCHATSMKKWFQTLQEESPSTATRIAPAVLGSFVNNHAAALLDTSMGRASVFMDACAYLLDATGLDFLRDPLPKLDASLASALSKAAALDPNRHQKVDPGISAISAWKRLANDPEDLPPSMQESGQYWAMWAAQHRMDNNENQDFFNNAWDQPGRAQALLDVAHGPDSPWMPSALGDLLTLNTDQWPVPERRDVLDAWATGMLDIKPHHVKVARHQMSKLYQARCNLGEPLPDQWQPIMAAIGVSVGSPLNSGVEPAKIINAVDAWREGRSNWSPEDLARFQALQLQWNLPPPSVEPTRAGPRF